jgi:ubiquinone/menaquinone biosynthesis C-methylase UbiE
VKNFRTSFYTFYKNIQKIIVPDLRNSQYHYRDELRELLDPKNLWLDLGCGRQLFPDWMPNLKNIQKNMFARCQYYIGIDYDLASLHDNKLTKSKIFGNIEKLPIRSGSMDVVSSNMVVEHVKDPDNLFLEVKRVLKSDGVFIFHTANLLNYGTFLSKLIPQGIKNRIIKYLENRDDEDVFPTYYRINTPSKIVHFGRKFGFEIIDMNMVNSSAELVNLGPLVIFELILIWFFNMRLFKNFRSNIICCMKKRQD